MYHFIKYNLKLKSENYKIKSLQIHQKIPQNLYIYNINVKNI